MMENISLEETFVGDHDIESTLRNSCNNYLSDVVNVTALPEKKGNALWKHTEYEIRSEKHKSRVERRFNDFVNLYQNFLRKHEYRMIVRIPPKQFMLDAFIEERRVKLQRWLFLISQHPILSRDEMFKIFLTEASEGHQEMIENFVIENERRNYPKADLNVIKEKQENARKLLNQILKIKRIIKQHYKRQVEIAEDFGSLSSSLSSVMEDASENSLKDFSENFQKLNTNFDKASHEKQLSIMLERIDLIIEVFTAFSDLTERVDESFRNEKTPTQLSHWQKLQNAIKGNYEINTGTDAREKRINLAVHCVSEEYKFALKYLKLLPSIMLKFSHEQSGVFANLAKVLNEVVEIESDKLNS